MSILDGFGIGRHEKTYFVRTEAVFSTWSTSLEVAAPPSTLKMIVFSCDNVDLIENIAVTVTDEL